MQVQNVLYLVREIWVGFHLVEIFDHHLVSLPRGNMQWSVTLFLEIRLHCYQEFLNTQC